MNTYLAVMTTVLVATQVIRVTQNFIRLKNLELEQADIEVQKKAFKLIVERLEGKVQ